MPKRYEPYRSRPWEPMSQPDTIPFAAPPFALEAEVARLIVTVLHLENKPEEIDPAAPLFGEGLGLDSIDALELALAISREYGVELKSDDERNRRIFASLRALAAHIGAARVR